MCQVWLVVIPDPHAHEAPTTASADGRTAADAQTLIDDVQTLTPGEELMFSMDVPYVPAQEAPIVLAQAGKFSAPVTPDFILSDCQETEHRPNDPRSAFGVVDPAYMLKNYLASKGSEVKLEDIKVTLLTSTQHGKLNAEFDSTGLLSYSYNPTPGYLGDDRATFMAQYKGKHYKIVVTIKVLAGVDENTPVCPAPTLIKGNSKPVSDSSPYLLNSFTLTLDGLTDSNAGARSGFVAHRFPPYS